MTNTTFRNLVRGLIAHFILVFSFTSLGSAKEGLPYLARPGETIQLIVDGQPFLVLGGELHNSTSSSRSYLAPYWEELAEERRRMDSYIISK